MSSEVINRESVEDSPNYPSAPSGQGRVRWRRFGAMMVASAALGAALVVMTAQGVLAVEFAISGIPFTVTADRLEGEGFEQYAGLDQMVPGSPNEGNTGGQVVVLVSAIREAKLTNLCQSINMGGINVKITAGNAGTPVTASTLVTDSDLITGGNAQFTKMNIGQDASTLDQVPGAPGKFPGILGQQAETVVITDLRQNNYATTAGLFTLPNLRMTFDEAEC